MFPNLFESPRSFEMELESSEFDYNFRKINTIFRNCLKSSGIIPEDSLSISKELKALMEL